MPRTHPAVAALRSTRAWACLRSFVAASNEHRLLGLAAETAFFAVLGIFPALLIAAGLLGMLDVIVGAELAAAVKDQLVSALNTVLTPEASPAIAAVASLFENRRGSLLTAATATALLTLSGAFAVVIDTLNHAYGIADGRTWWRRRLLGLAMGAGTMVFVVLALAIVVIGPLLGRGQELVDFLGLGEAFSFAWNVLRLPLLVVGLVGWAAVLFHLAPSERYRWREAVPGAVLTTTLWILATAGFHLYLVVAADANPVLGAFGGGLIVMVWTYLLCLALLLGGELNALLHRGTGPARNGERRANCHEGRRPMHAVEEGPSTARR